MKVFKVKEECIACQACVGVAKDNFAIGSKIAYLKKQPETKEEEEKCEKAMEICPVKAIVVEKEEEVLNTKPILAKDNIKATLDKYPQLKDILVSRSDKFKKLLNPVTYNTLARFASFTDAARVTGISICEILHILNKALGTMEQLKSQAPDCIAAGEQPKDIMEFSKPITWKESGERYIYNKDSMPEILEKVTNLKPQGNIVIISVEEPYELVKTVEGLGFLQHIDKTSEYRVSIFNPQEKVSENWQDRKESFEKLDVRYMMSDPFDIIIKKAYATPEGEGFILIQVFEPYPLINMLTEMGFEYVTEQKSIQEVWVYFYKKPLETDEDESQTDKTEVVIQSATPVAYPVIMRLLQSQVIRKKLSIKELKVWEETEKHMAWVSTGKADITFSALLTILKLKKFDLKVPSMFVWDNFLLLTKLDVETLDDLKGKEIYTPLFEEAPPAKITRYLLKAHGLNPDEFVFKFGEPFGRPEEIYTAFVSGQADTVILREPEASYAIKIMRDRGEKFSILSFNDLWNNVNPGFGSFPNAGILFKGEFVRKHPELTRVFLDELKKAIDWVNSHRKEAAKLSFDMMRQPADRVELFLERVHFEFVEGEELIKKVKSYFDVLLKEKIIEADLDEEFYDLFRLDK